MTVPAGSIFAWAGNAVPKGYIVCDGSSYKQKQYPQLFAAIGTIWGGDAADEFKVPDLRGRFLRGVDHGVGRDINAKNRRGDNGRLIGDAPGSVQADAIQSHRHEDFGHTHEFRSPRYQPGDDDQANQAYSLWSIDHESKYPTEKSCANLSGPTTLTSEVRVEEETRPKNAYVDFIIKVTND